MKRLLSINGFQKGHLLTWQFYWLFWAAFRYQLTGYPGLISNGVNRIGVTGAYPDQALWDADWRVSKLGSIFGATILFYEPPRTLLPAFALALPIHKWERAATSLPFARAIAIVAVLLICTFAANAQTVTDCPHPDGCVVISRAAALKAIADDAKVKAYEAEMAAKDKAYADLKDLLNRMRIEFAEKSGEVTALKQAAVRSDAIIDLLLKGQKAKCLPFSVCIGR